MAQVRVSTGGEVSEGGNPSAVSAPILSGCRFQVDGRKVKSTVTLESVSSPHHRRAKHLPLRMESQVMVGPEVFPYKGERLYIIPEVNSGKIAVGSLKYKDAPGVTNALNSDGRYLEKPLLEDVIFELLS